MQKIKNQQKYKEYKEFNKAQEQKARYNTLFFSVIGLIGQS